MAVDDANLPQRSHDSPQSAMRAGDWVQERSPPIPVNAGRAQHESL